MSADPTKLPDLKLASAAQSGAGQSSQQDIRSEGCREYQQRYRPRCERMATGRCAGRAGLRSISAARLMPGIPAIDSLGVNSAAGSGAHQRVQQAIRDRLAGRINSGVSGLDVALLAVIGAIVWLVSTR